MNGRISVFGRRGGARTWRRVTLRIRHDKKRGHNHEMVEGKNLKGQVVMRCKVCRHHYIFSNKQLFIVQQLREKVHLKFWVKTSAIFAISAFVFSIITLTMPVEYCDWCEEDNPDLTETILIAHMIGHIIFGLAIAVPSWRMKYIVASGLFVVMIDFDHVLRYILRIFEYDFTIDLISRSGHSAVFALAIAIIFVLVYKKDYMLGVVAGASVFGHMAFDTFGGSGVFPLFMPFTNEPYYFNQEWWVMMFAAGFTIIMSTRIILWMKSKAMESELQVK